MDRPEWFVDGVPPGMYTFHVDGGQYGISVNMNGSGNAQLNWLDRSSAGAVPLLVTALTGAAFLVKDLPPGSYSFTFGGTGVEFWASVTKIPRE